MAWTGSMGGARGAPAGDDALRNAPGRDRASGVRKGSMGALKVISASRRVDMVAGYRDELIKTLKGECPPERVHTIVLWTKSPPRLERDRELRDFLSRYDQIFLHLTVTGLGGSDLEPRAPRWRESAAALPGLVEFVKSPDRVRLRFDPLLEVEASSGEVLSNQHLFEDVAAAGLACGINNISTSWATSYNKVSSRLGARGMRLLPRSEAQLKTLWREMEARAESAGVTLHACCVPGIARSRCVDGELLNRLHPKGHLCSTKRARGQRPLCGCTESFDIGWYKPCPTGCLYCYANPAP